MWQAREVMAVVSSFLLAAPALSAEASPVRQASACDAHNNVGAIFETDAGGRSTLLCTGVLIDDDVVLTAAHCLMDPIKSHTRDLMRFSFVLGERPFPTREAPQFSLRSISISPGFDLRRLKQLPLFARPAEGDAETKALKAIDDRCGEREADRFGEQDWLQCLLQQAPELRRAVGLNDKDSGDHDLALVFLQPNSRQERQGGLWLPTACNVRQGKSKELDGAPSSPHNKERLGLLGYGQGHVSEDAGVVRAALDFLFTPLRRREQVVRVSKTGTYRLQLADEAVTCEADGGAALFRLPRPGKPAQLVGLISRRPLAQSPCGKGGLATNLAPYWPWIDRSLSEACARGKRHHAVCPEMGAGTAHRPKRTRVNDLAKTDE